MTVQRRQAVLLGILALLLVWFVWFRLIGGQQGAAGGGAGVARDRHGKAGAPERVAEFDLKRLTPSPGVFTPGRDIFSYGRRPAARHPAPAATPKPSVSKSDKDESTSQEEDSAPKPPPVDVTYLGTFGPKEALIVVFSNGSTIINARQGDVVEDRYVVRHIGYESVDLGFVGFPDEVVHRMSPGR